jgi:hypothetical protein
MLLLDQPAAVSWVDGMRKEPSGKLVPNSKSENFESVRLGLQFVMETLSGNCRETALIHTDDVTLHQADIKNMYASLK